jgi:hypothetical protein
VLGQRRPPGVQCPNRARAAFNVCRVCDLSRASSPTLLWLSHSLLAAKTPLIWELWQGLEDGRSHSARGAQEMWMWCGWRVVMEDVSLDGDVGCESAENVSRGRDRECQLRECQSGS